MFDSYFDHTSSSICGEPSKDAIKARIRAVMPAAGISARPQPAFSASLIAASSAAMALSCTRSIPARHVAALTLFFNSGLPP
jgi:hypothetical protein